MTTANTVAGSVGDFPSSLQGFDSNLGTLTGITLQVSAQTEIVYLLTYTDFRLQAGSAVLSLHSPFDVLLNGQTYTFDVSGAQNLSYRGSTPPTGLQSFTASGSATFNINPALFSTFIGASNICPGSSTPGVCVMGNATSLNFIQSSNNLSFLVTDNASTAHYTLTYTYTPSVPEPGTWRLMLLGFGVVGFAVRRRKAILVRL